jgi:hypothetical protein
VNRPRSTIRVLASLWLVTVGLVAPAGAEETGAPRPASVHRFSIRALVSVDVDGRLRVGDREAGRRGLAALLARLEGRELARRPDPGDPAVELIEIVVPRAAYAEFRAGLGRLGRWDPERETHESAEHARIVVRLAD